QPSSTSFAICNGVGQVDRREPATMKKNGKKLSKALPKPLCGKIGATRSSPDCGPGSLSHGLRAGTRRLLAVVGIESQLKASLAGHGPGQEGRRVPGDLTAVGGATVQVPRQPLADVQLR